MNEQLWAPTPAAVAACAIDRFRRQAEQTSGQTLPDYAALHAWSVRERGAFWRQAWDFCEIIGDPGTIDVEAPDAFFGVRWFPEARLNFAENLLARRDEKTAFVSLLENGARREVSYRALYEDTARLAAWLRAQGVGPGDRVAAWMPNIPETAVAMLATASLGAVFSSCSPDFGANGALDRFGQIEPKVLIACDGYYYNGKTINIQDKVTEVAAAVPSVEQVVWVSVLGSDTAGGERWESLVAGEVPALEFTRVPFDHPLYIMYSSGTTGKPKCIVHGVGGTLLQHAKEHRLHTNLSEQDTLFFFTTAGWMMWNWLVSALATGCTIVLYDGSPFHPAPTTLWDMADRERVTVFGISAKYLQSVENAGVRPMASHDLSSVRMLISTGSTLPHEGFRFVYRDIKADVHLVSMTGGTDIISCFILGNPTLPVHAGELQSAGLGMDTQVWDEDGQPVVGGRGELVCTRPFPSAPIGFWNDEGDTRYKAAYFERFDNVWAHGDFAERTAHDGFIIHGRSDAVLNPGGVRIGTAEIYRQVETFDEVLEAVCIGQDWHDDVRVVLFVVLREDAELTPTLVDAIRQRIRTQASPRHVPARIIHVPDIPRTMSGKIAELAVRDVVHGRTVKNTSALANPEALAHFADIEELAPD